MASSEGVDGEGPCFCSFHSGDTDQGRVGLTLVSGEVIGVRQISGIFNACVCPTGLLYPCVEMHREECAELFFDNLGAIRLVKDPDLFLDLSMDKVEKGNSLEFYIGKYNVPQRFVWDKENSTISCASNPELFLGVVDENLETAPRLHLVERIDAMVFAQKEILYVDYKSLLPCLHPNPKFVHMHDVATPSNQRRRKNASLLHKLSIVPGAFRVIILCLVQLFDWVSDILLIIKWASREDTKVFVYIFIVFTVFYLLYSMLSMLLNKKYNHTLKWMGPFKHVISVLLILTGLHSPFIAYLSIEDSIEDSTLNDFNFMKIIEALSESVPMSIMVSIHLFDVGFDTFEMASLAISILSLTLGLGLLIVECFLQTSGRTSPDYRRRLSASIESGLLLHPNLPHFLIYLHIMVDFMWFTSAFSGAALAGGGLQVVGGYLVWIPMLLLYLIPTVINYVNCFFFGEKRNIILYCIIGYANPGLFFSQLIWHRCLRKNDEFQVSEFVCSALLFIRRCVLLSWSIITVWRFNFALPWCVFIGSSALLQFLLSYLVYHPEALLKRSEEYDDVKEVSPQLCASPGVKLEGEKDSSTSDNYYRGLFEAVLVNLDLRSQVGGAKAGQSPCIHKRLENLYRSTSFKYERYVDDSHLCCVKLKAALIDYNASNHCFLCPDSSVGASSLQTMERFPQLSRLLEKYAFTANLSSKEITAFADCVLSWTSDPESIKVFPSKINETMKEESSQVHWCEEEPHMRCMPLRGFVDNIILGSDAYAVVAESVASELVESKVKPDEDEAQIIKAKKLYSFSEASTDADWFISYRWVTCSRCKYYKLMYHFVAKRYYMYIVCISVVLATVLVPFGAVLETIISIPFWSPSLAIILIAMIFMMYIWMHLTFPYTMTHIFGHAPWRNHITESMWLDKTCTPQEPFDMQRTVQWIKTVPKFQRKCKGKMYVLNGQLVLVAVLVLIQLKLEKRKSEVKEI